MLYYNSTRLTLIEPQWEVVLQPTYFPDLASSDFLLRRSTQYNFKEIFEKSDNSLIIIRGNFYYPNPYPTISVVRRICEYRFN